MQAKRYAWSLGYKLLSLKNVSLDCELALLTIRFSSIYSWVQVLRGFKVACRVLFEKIPWILNLDSYH